MKCPDLDTLRLLVSEKLSAEEYRCIEAHVDECASCRTELRRLVMGSEPILVGRDTVGKSSERSALPPEQISTQVDTPPEQADPDATTPASSAKTAAAVKVPRGADTRYPIKRLHAKGGLGEVFVAEEPSLNREVALKRIQVRFQRDPESLRRFLQEAEITGRLEHPGVVPVYGMDRDAAGHPCYAMRFIRGETLHEAIKRFHEKEKPGRDPGERSLALRELLDRFKAVCNTVAYAHSRGILHRDLKPGNVMLNKYGETLVVDWGLAKHVERDENAGTSGEEETLAPSAASGDSGTQTGQAMGTPSYMSPEQASGQTSRLGPATDIYSLGAILYTLLAGKSAFTDPNVSERLEKVKRGEFPRPRQVKRDCPPALEAICLKAMALRPQDRYATGLEVAEDVDHWLADEAVRAWREPWRAWSARLIRRHSKWVQAAAAALLLVTAITIVAAIVVNEARKLAAKKDVERLSAETREAEAQAREANEKSERLRAETLPLIERAATFRAQGFHQAEALYLAKALALPENDDPKIRAQWMEAMQRSLVPVETSSRRLLIGALAYSPDGRELVSGDFLGGMIRVWRTDNGMQSLVLGSHPCPDPTPEKLKGISAVRGVVFRPDKTNEFVSVGLDGMVRCWDRSLGQQSWTISAGAPLLALAIEPSVEPVGGRRMVTGDIEGRLVWWDVDSRRRIKEVAAAHPQQVNVVRYRPDGRECASTGPDGVVRLWDSEGNALATLVLPDWKQGQLPVWMYDLAYSPDGRQLAVGARDGIYIWDIDKRTLAWHLEGHEAGAKEEDRLVYRLVYSSQGRLFSGGEDGTIREWDTYNGKQVGSKDCRHSDNVYGARKVVALAVRPDGREIASSAQDVAIRIWDASIGKPLAQLEGEMPRKDGQPSFSRIASAFCANKHLLLTAPERAIDTFVRSWDTRTLRERDTYGGFRRLDDDLLHTKRVSGLAVHPDGSHFVSAEPNGDLVWWDTASGEQLDRSEEAHKPLGKLTFLSQPAIAALAWSHDGKRVASAGIDGTLKLWDTQNRRQPLGIWKEEEPETLSPALPEVLEKAKAKLNVSRDGFLLSAGFDRPRIILLFDHADNLITAGRDSVIRVWKLGAGPPQIVDRLRTNAGRVNALALNSGADGKLLASGSEDGFVLIWDLNKRRCLRMIALKPLRSLDLLRILPKQTEHDRFTLAAQIQEQYAAVRSLSFSPDGHWLAVVLQDSSVSLVDIATATVTYRGIGHETDEWGKSAITAYFTREGELLTVGGDGTVRHWDLPAWSTGRRVIDASPLISPVSRSFDATGCAVRTNVAIMQWSPRTGRLQKDWSSIPQDLANQTWDRNKFDPPQALGCGRSDGKVVLATYRGQVLVLDLKTGKTVAEFKGPDGNRQLRVLPPVEQRVSWPIGAVAINPKDSLAASAWEDGSVDIWRIEDGCSLPGRCGRIPEGLGRVTGLAFSPDGRQLAVTYAEGDLRLWDVESGTSQFAKLVGPKNAGGLCYSPDGMRLIQAGDDPIIAVWDPRTGKRLPSLKGHVPVSMFGFSAAAHVRGVAYRPDGKWLATGGADGTIRLWEWDAKATPYQPMAVLSVVTIKSGFKSTTNGMVPLRPSPAIASLTFTADGSQLVAVRVDSKIRVYDLKSIEDNAKTLLAETETATGLRLQEDRQQGDRFIPIQQLRLAREGATLRPTYEQDVDEFTNRAGLAASLVLQGRPAEGQNLLESLLNEPGVPDLAEEYARTLMAHAHTQSGELKQAEAEVNGVLTKNPNNSMAQCVLALIYLKEARYDEGVDLLETILAVPGLLPQAEMDALGQLALHYHSRGWRYQTTGQFAKAKEDYNNADRIYNRFLQMVPPGNNRRGHLALRAAVNYRLGLLENDEGQPKESLRWLDSAIDKAEAVRKEDPGNNSDKTTLQDIHLARASSLSRLGRYDDAATDLDEASKLDDGKRKELIKFQRAVLAARKQNHELGRDELATYQQAANEKKALDADAALQMKAQGIKATPGSQLYDDAVLYALFLNCCEDRNLTPEKRKDLRDQFATRAVEALQQAKTARFFAAPSNRDMLRKETAFNALKERDDFKELRANVEAEAEAPVNGP
jgi:eukaryotic-like serine/threonine-protein kinase